MFVHVMPVSNPTFVESAFYAPCSNCNEGTLTWDPVAKTSRCETCDEPYVPDVTVTTPGRSADD